MIDIEKFICSLINRASGFSVIKVIDIIDALNNQGLDYKDGKIVPIDNKPKFKKGDWLCENEPNNYARFIQILETVNVQGKERYRISRDIHNDEDIVEFDFVEKYYHKFDIKDTKDGDVLVSQSQCDLGTWYGIFKSLDDNESMTVHCYLARDGKFETRKELCFDKDVSGVKPATKEQRDTLMKAMNDAGYTFDFDKKELKDIVVPIFNIGDTIIKKHNSGINNFGQFTITDITGGKYWYNDRIICDIIEQDEWELYEPVRQNSAEWSEEDENIRQWIISDIEKLLSLEKKSFIIADKEIDWLKFLKDRVGCETNCTTMWKPSGEQMKILHKYAEQNNYDGAILTGLYDDLLKVCNLNK